MKLSLGLAAVIIFLFCQIAKAQDGSPLIRQSKALNGANCVLVTLYSGGNGDLSKIGITERLIGSAIESDLHNAGIATVSTPQPNVKRRLIELKVRLSYHIPAALTNRNMDWGFSMDVYVPAASIYDPSHSTLWLEACSYGSVSHDKPTLPLMLDDIKSQISEFIVDYVAGGGLTDSKVSADPTKVIH